MRRRFGISYRGGVQAVKNPIEWTRQHQFAADAILGAIFIVIAVILGLVSEPDPGERTLGGLGWALIVVVNVPLAYRRRSPVAALWLTVAFTLPYWVLDFPDQAVGPNILIMIYSVAAHVDRPRSFQHALAAGSAATFVALVGVLVPQEDLPWFLVPVNFLLFVSAWVFGDNLRNRRAYLDELEQKAVRTAHSRDLEARRAVSEERTRIARELHDVVAHSMSVMVVQAGAARRLLQDQPDQAAEAISAIESTGRESLNEMRRVLDVLRSDNDEIELAPAPSLQDLDRLVSQCADAGLPVTVETEGDPRPLPASIHLSAYRIIQESLTNSLKHAGPARATVRLVYESEEFCVEVSDDGRGSATGPATTGNGQGLLGMRERVEAFGGSLRSGPASGGGFRVSARFPVDYTS